MNYQFYYCTITHIPTGDNWVVQSYCESPEQALNFKRLTWKDARLWRIEIDKDKN